MTDCFLQPHDLDEEAARDLACEILYRFLSVAIGDPQRPQWHRIRDPASQEAARCAADFLRHDFTDQPTPLGFGELPAEELDWQPLLAELNRPHDELRAEFVRVFGLVPCAECPPYETEYYSAGEVFFRSQQMADAAGFYAAFGLEPTYTARERPDYLGLQLEFSAFLLMKKRLAQQDHANGEACEEQKEICHQARVNFFRNHLSWWTPSFALSLRRKAEHGLYAAAGQVLAALLPIERHRMQVPAPRMPLQAELIEPPEQCAGCAAENPC